jgi:transcriptional regulator with XRE-family HTH domain
MQDNENNYLNIISKNIKKFREYNGLSQELLAEKVDCSREFINRVENRKEDVSLKMLLKLSFVFKVNPQQFFTD